VLPGVRERVSQRVPRILGTAETHERAAKSRLDGTEERRELVVR
jgi:hypothetical protein